MTIEPFTTKDCRDFEEKNLDPNFRPDKADKTERIDYLYHILRTLEKEVFRDLAEVTDPDEAAYLTERLARVVNGINCLRPLAR